MPSKLNSNRVQDNPQFYHHLKTDDYHTILEQSKRDYERCLTERMQSEITELGLVRKGYRKPRAFHTGFGTIWLKIPRVLHTNYIPSFVVQNSPFDYQLLYAIQSMYLGGMSQQAIADHLNEVYNLDGVTKRQVQTAIQKIIKPSLEFLDRDLSETYYPAIFVDSHYTPIREGSKVSKKAVMIAIGTRSDGSREVLGMDIQTSEATSNYTLFFQKLKKRGLQSPEVVVSDEHKGLRLAIRRNFPLSCCRRCNFHLLKSAGKLTGFDSEFTKALSKALLQNNHLSLVHDTTSLLERYRNLYPQATGLIEESLVDLMNFYPDDAFAGLTATNNVSESLNSLIRSRTDAVRVFPHSEAYIKLVGNLLIERSIKWSQTPSLEEELSYELNARKDRRFKEVRESLETTSLVSAKKTISPCILWLDVFYQDVSIRFVNVSVGVIVAFGCDALDGKRRPLAFEYILDDVQTSVDRLIESLKNEVDLKDLFLIVAPLSLEPFGKAFKTSFPKARWQLDVSSFMELVIHIAPKKQREEFSHLLKELYKSQDLREFQQRRKRFTDRYARRFPRAIAEFEKYVDQTATFLSFNLPKKRISRVDQMSKSLLCRLKDDLPETMTPFKSYPKVFEFDEALRLAFKKELDCPKNRAYIHPDKLSKYIK